MRKRIISMLFVLSAFIVPASVQAQWVVSDPGNLVPVSYTHLTLPTKLEV